MNLRITVEWMPIHILVGGVIFTLYGLGQFYISNFYWPYPLVFLLGLVMTTSRHLVTIDQSRKSYSDFYWVLGFKMQNHTSSYQNIPSVALTSGNYSQQYGMYVRRHISGVIYKIYLDLENDEPIYVGQSKDLEKAKTRAKKIAEDLGVEIRDLTDNNQS